MKLKKATPSDAYALSYVHNACFAETWSENDFCERMEESSIWTFFIMYGENGEPVGYLSAYIIVDEASIANIAIMPKYRKNGYGSSILENFIAYCKGKDVAKIMLEVRKSNMGAISLYKKYGFDVVGESVGHYSCPVENALLMNKLL